MNNLFDVFEEQPNGSTDGNSTPSQARKRLANGAVKAQEEPQQSNSPKDADKSSPPVGFKRLKRDNSNEVIEDGKDTPAQNEDEQALRKIEPEARVADAFETEQSREVAGAAGLQAQNESGNVVLSHQVRHQVSLPLDYDYKPINNYRHPGEPARTWPFELDPFQKVSIASVQRNESVLVSAHTSAGKTVVAEYAIAQCLKNNQRVIYTSPIKALSNQKYREFNETFGDVGLMTGDVTINPTATCLVMTTEILRSMLYRGSEIMREVGWVVFDEVHYLRDKSRGVVWEETIILLPDKVRYVFLSATIPNAMQFAEWVTKTHNQPCHVVYTDFRPTPLQHYLFPAGGDGIHLVVDEKGAFREDNFGKAMHAIADRQGDNPADPMARRRGKGKDRKFNKGGNKGPSDIYKIVKMIMQRNFNPVIVFSFSKRECEAYALQMSQLSFNNTDEKDMVSKVFNGALDSLTTEDRELPQIQNILPLLRRGIGIHHSGLLPLLKEVIEILFQEGLLKVLFATETFSIGLNMPAKTVVFTSVRKFDGHSQRWVTPSEFIQMSGRAGRRGLDERGIVIMMIDEKMEPAVAKEIVRGEQDKLNSAFHLGYNMILNLLRVEGVSPEFMLEKCFYQFQNTASVSGLEKQLHEAETEKANIQIQDESSVRDYFELRKQLDNNASDVHDVVTHPNYCLQFMQPGRMIHVKWQDLDFGWGAVVQHRKVDAKKLAPDSKPQDMYNVDAAVIISADTSSDPSSYDLPPSVRPAKEGEPAKLEIIPVALTAIDQIGHIRLFLPDNLNAPGSMESLHKSVLTVLAKFTNGLAVLDPIDHMGIRDEKFKKLLKKIEVLQNRLKSTPLTNSPRLTELFDQYSKKMEYHQKARNLKKQINTALAVMQLEELKCRKRVLRRLGFINEHDVVQLKARVACEISTGDELVLSELLFNRFFNEMSPEQCAACLSCFIFEEKADEPDRLRDDLQRPFKEIQKQARIVAKVSQESKMVLNEDEYVQGFKPQLMEVVFSWTKGASFASICKMTEVYEGNLIRLFRRLEELLRQIAQAAKVMGSEELEKKFEEALLKLRRDIVSAQSLYL
ncbi:MAG: hypothetical protein Q9159_002192 [Coniocarpon cinnabarinum]